MLQHDQLNPILDTTRYDSVVQVTSPKQIVDREYLDSNLSKLKLERYQVPAIQVTGSTKIFTLTENYTSGTLKIFVNERLVDTGLITEESASSFSFFVAPNAGSKIEVFYHKTSASSPRTIAGRLPIKVVSFADTLDVSVNRGAVVQGSNATQVTILSIPPGSDGLELFFKASPTTTLTVIPSAPDTINSLGQLIIPAGEGYRYIYREETRDLLPVATQLAAQEINLLAATPIGSYVSWDVETVERV